MPPLLLNPNSAQCPDYTLDIYQNAHTPFINDNTTDQQATMILANVWAANNAVEKLIWQEQADIEAAQVKVRR
jgi:hypothetical protein